MNKKAFNKTPTTYEQQIALLTKRNLNIPDIDRALRYLQQIGYYRLSAYFPPYQEIKDQFNDGIYFDQILNTYRFDRELRLLVFDCIERIEIAIRSQINNVLAHKYKNSHWQDNPQIFKPPYINKFGVSVWNYDDVQKIIRNNCNSKNPEVFIKHYLNNYYTPKNPPSWMCIELLTIGELSRLYSSLLSNQDKQDIADFFELHQTVFSSWLHTLTYARNICAHHSRLWNRDFAIKPSLLIKPKRKWLSPNYSNNHRTFYFLCVLKYLLWAANPNNHLTKKLDELFEKYPNIPIQFIGINSDMNGNIINWKNEPLWQ